MKSRLFVSRLILISAALALAGCTAGNAEDAMAVAPPAPAVTTADVVVRDLRQWADFTGRLRAVNRVEIRARVSGYLESVRFKEGERVKKGDLLFRIDPRPFQAEVDRLEAERDRAKAELKLAVTNETRAKHLLAQDAIAREESDRLVAAADAAKAELAAAAAELEAARLNLSFTQVSAPISGRISRAIVTAGNLVDSDTLLTTVVSDDSLYAYFDVDEHTYLDMISGAQEGAMVYFGLVNERGYPHQARLDSVDNRINPDSGTIRARATVDNDGGKLTPGLFVRLRVVASKGYRAALVDPRAIGTDLDRKYVLVVDDQSTAQYRAVETGQVLGGKRIVTRGLVAGDVLIVNGLQHVRPGMKVTATRVAAQPPSDVIKRFVFLPAHDDKPSSVNGAEPQTMLAKAEKRTASGSRQVVR